MTAQTGPTLISSVQRALRLLDAVAAADHPLTAKTLARLTGQPLPTTYHLLRTLVHEGYLRRLEGAYVLGQQAIALSGSGVLRPAGAARLQPILARLHAELRAAAYFSVLDDGQIRLVQVVDSPAAPRVDLWVGFHEAAHATALGKAVLSALDAGQRREYLAEHDLADLTPRTVTDRRVLLRQLDAASPYAVDREEYAVGTACLAAAVPSPSALGAVAVSVPVRQSARIFERRGALRRAAQLIAYALAG